MKILYLSSSIIPSQKANSVNVMKMSNALAKCGNEVTLVGIKGEGSENEFQFYNIEENFKIVLIKNSKNKFISLIKRIIVSIKLIKKNNLIYTRWPLIAFIASFLSNNIILEHHHLQFNLFNKILERNLAKNKAIKCHVFITKALMSDFILKYPEAKKNHNIVLPDGADIKSEVKVKDHTQKYLECGYIGSFLKGKGIEVILELANSLPNNKFHIVGGRKEEIEFYKLKQKNNNIEWYGFLPHKEAMDILENVDIALLPNQENVIISKANMDIGKWTSPMKLFEYMSYGKIIIASDLAVIKEVLVDEYNCLLANPKKNSDWVQAVKKLESDTELRKRISLQAKKDLENKYSWYDRANSVIAEYKKNLKGA